jgi:hypothetical protein
MRRLLFATAIAVLLSTGSAYAEDSSKADAAIQAIKDSIAFNLKAAKSSDFSLGRSLSILFTDGESQGYMFTGLRKTGANSYFATYIRNSNDGRRSIEEGQIGQRELFISDGQLKLKSTDGMVYGISSATVVPTRKPSSDFFLKQLRAAASISEESPERCIFIGDQVVRSFTPSKVQTIDGSSLNCAIPKFSQCSGRISCKQAFTLKYGQKVEAEKIYPVTCYAPNGSCPLSAESCAEDTSFDEDVEKYRKQGFSGLPGQASSAE